MHVQRCWLALLCLRVVENATDDTWRNVRHKLDRMHLITRAALSPGAGLQGRHEVVPQDHRLPR